MMIRRMEEKDIGQVEQIEKSLFTDAWSRQGFYDTLQSPYVIALVAEDAYIPGNVGKMAVNENTGIFGNTGKIILGYIVMYVSFEEGEICNVAVAKTAQNQGIGSILLNGILEQGTSCGVTKFVLEVRRSNDSAIGLYRKYGFEGIGIRRGFYENPPEDALIMVLEKS